MTTPDYTPAAFPLLRLRALRSAGYRCANCSRPTGRVTEALIVECETCALAECVADRAAEN